ncbi:unnamed protein product, partial [Gordionus sp. m RMFG-2023]
IEIIWNLFGDEISHDFEGIQMGSIAIGYEFIRSI